MSKTISARVEEQMFEKILEFSNKHGLSVNEFLKSAILDKINPNESEKKDSVEVWDLERLKKALGIKS